MTNLFLHIPFAAPNKSAFTICDVEAALVLVSSFQYSLLYFPTDNELKSITLSVFV